MRKLLAGLLCAMLLLGACNSSPGKGDGHEPSPPPIGGAPQVRAVPVTVIEWQEQPVPLEAMVRLPEAVVWVRGRELKAVTDATGKAQLTLPYGEQTLVVSPPKGSTLPERSFKVTVGAGSPAAYTLFLTRGSPPLIVPLPDRLAIVHALSSYEAEQFQMADKATAWVDGEVQIRGDWQRFFVWSHGCTIGTDAGGDARYHTEYPCPTQLGELTITAISRDGKLLSFRSATGATGTFSLETKQWAITPTQPPRQYSTRAYDWWYIPNRGFRVPGFNTEVVAFAHEQNGVWLGPTTSKTIYLTFDGGGDLRNTRQILAVLKKHQVKTIFFITGDFFHSQATSFDEILADGHALGNHTISHPNLTQLSSEQFDAEVDGVDRYYHDLTGKHMRFFRPPFGAFSEDVLARLNAKGYRTVFWSIAMKDWEPMPGGKEEALHGVIDHLHPGAVILLHVGSNDDLNALDEIITKATEMGYSFGDPESL